MSLDDLKSIPILSVAEHLGLQVKGHRSHCFNPDHRDTTPSLNFNESENYFYCFGCGIKGTNIDLVMKFFKIELDSAIKWLSKEFGFTQGGNQRIRTRPTTRSSPKTPQKSPTRKPRAPDTEIYAWILEHAPLSNVSRRYIYSRGLSSETVSHFRLSGHDDPKELILHAVRQFGSERTRNAGLLNDPWPSSQLRPIWWDPVLIIPFFWRSKDPIFLQARRLISKSGGKYLGLNGLPKPLFNAQNILNLPAKERLFILEGAMDVMAAYEIGLNAIGVLGASTKFKSTWVKALEDFHLTILPHGDKAGLQFKNNIVTAFRQAGKSVEVEYLPSDFKDLAETLNVLKKGTL